MIFAKCAKESAFALESIVHSCVQSVPGIAAVPVEKSAKCPQSPHCDCTGDRYNAMALKPWPLDSVQMPEIQILCISSIEVDEGKFKFLTFL